MRWGAVGIHKKKGVRERERERERKRERERERGIISRNQRNLLRRLRLKKLQEHLKEIIKDKIDKESRWTQSEAKRK